MPSSPWSLWDLNVIPFSTSLSTISSNARFWTAEQNLRMSATTTQICHNFWNTHSLALSAFHDPPCIYILTYTHITHPPPPQHTYNHLMGGWKWWGEWESSTATLPYAESMIVTAPLVCLRRGQDWIERAGVCEPRRTLAWVAGRQSLTAGT